MDPIMDKKRYDQFLRRSDTALMVETITLQSEPLYVVSYTDDESAVTIACEDGFEILALPGPVAFVGVQDENKAVIFFWKEKRGDDIATDDK